MRYISTTDPLATEAVAAIQGGDVDRLKRLLAENPPLGGSRLKDSKLGCGESSRTLLHVVTDWPGHFPNGAEAVVALVVAGADVNATF